MSQSVVDLPDPMATEGVESAKNTDDLLSQLAGNEIDRLLAEADEENSGKSKKPKSVAAPIVEMQPSLPDAQPTDSSVDEEVNSDNGRELTAEADDRSSAVAQAMTDAPTATADVEQSLSPSDSSADALAAEMEQDAAAVPAVMPIDQPTADGPALDVPSVLDEVLTTATVSTPTRQPAVWLKPLYWINRPFENLDDSTRSLLGKVALLTLLNAAVLIAYVLFWRR